MVVVALAFVSVASSFAWARGESAITGVRVSQNGDRSRVVLDFSKRVTFRHFSLSDPCRIVFDLDQVDWQLPVDRLTIENDLLKSLRYGLFQPGTSRVVLDCSAPLAIDEARFIPGQGGQGQRLVVDLIRTSEAVFAKMVRVPDSAGAKQEEANAKQADDAETAADTLRHDGSIAKTDVARTESNDEPSPGTAIGASPESKDAVDRKTPVGGTTIAKTSRGIAPVFRPLPPALTPTPVVFRAPLRKPHRVSSQMVIVLDPGHGGQDPGAISSSGVREAKITLRAARILRQELLRRGHYRVVMTRDRDTFVRLRDRIRIAREAGADLFLSIHADANPVSWVRGASVYTLSEKASDDEAAALAERENKVDLISGVDLSVEEPEVATILIDLAQRETMNDSARLASMLVDELGRSTALLRNTHRFAGFAVLKAPDVPSVLVELGLLSNREDERLLQREAYLLKLATAVAMATDTYFRGTKEARLR
ncbi:MAG: N-acetylmuramoyl-L-alanine amidase [Rhodospirillales bacterium]|nr:N-acetylmuramoyl-L-alanine amidase [Rhodospirillales bacterium]